MAVNPKSLSNLKTISEEHRNKKGRPPSLTKNLREYLNDNPEVIPKINKALIKQAVKGSLGHITTVYDKIDGPTKIKVDVSVYSEAFSAKKKKELEQIIEMNER